MADLLNTGAAYLAGQLKASASEAVTYSRPSVPVSGSLQTTYARQLLSVTDRSGHVRVERADRDFVFSRADLVALLGAWDDSTDARGDRVTLADGDVYEVTPMGVNEPAWRFSDPFKTLVRVHTKAV